MTVAKKIKESAISLRKRGYTYGEIVIRLGVPKATLHGWFGDLVLSAKSRKILLEKKRQNLVILRKKAVVVLRERQRVASAKLTSELNSYFADVKFDIKTKEMLLAMLYLGEGFKNRSQVALGNSNPEILQMFVRLIKEIYHVTDENLRCYLYLRMDQDGEKEKRYWSKRLNLPTTIFRKPQFDKKTGGTKTWLDYHGVCSVGFGNAMVDKRLKIVQNILVKKILGG